MEQLSNCPVCNSREFENYLECTDYTVTEERFFIQNCKKCGFKFTNPRPSLSEIGRYYDSVDYISHSNTNKGLINKLYHIVKNRAIKQKIKLIENLKPETQEILDIGCGSGSFLNEIRAQGWSTNGIEPDIKTREFCRQTLNLNVFEEAHLKSLKRESFSTITMWHVLEHVHNLRERVIEIYELLRIGGYALIAVPNYTSKDAG